MTFKKLNFLITPNPNIWGIGFEKTVFLFEQGYGI